MSSRKGLTSWQRRALKLHPRRPAHLSTSKSSKCPYLLGFACWPWQLMRGKQTPKIILMPSTTRWTYFKSHHMHDVGVSLSHCQQKPRNGLCILNPRPLPRGHSFPGYSYANFKEWENMQRHWAIWPISSKGRMKLLRHMSNALTRNWWLSTTLKKTEY